MDLRKNVPIQNENSPSPVKGSKKAFFQLIDGLAAIIALLFSMQSNYQSKPNTPNVQNVQKVAVLEMPWAATDERFLGCVGKLKMANKSGKKNEIQETNIELVESDCDVTKFFNALEEKDCVSDFV